MIEAVVMGQSRFVTPGVSADERGVAMGRRLLCLFPDMHRALGFFRTLSRTGALKDLLGSLLLETVAGSPGTREVAAGFDVAGSFQADPCAAAARAHDGLVYTGAEVHYVPYRDSTRPLGVDVADPAVLRTVEAGVVLYSEAGADVRTTAQRLEFRDLLVRMAPFALRPGEVREQRVDYHVVRVPRGVLAPVRSYLWRRRIETALCMARVRADSVFGQGAGEVALLRCRELPPGALALLASIPGVEVHVPVLDNVLVQRGFRHPVSLEACAGLFPPDEVTLFAGARRAVERLAGPLQYVPLDDVTHVTLLSEPGTPLPAPMETSVTDIRALPVEVRLVSDPLARGSAEAVLIPPAQLPDLVALVHLLPESLWLGAEVALAEPFTVVLSPAGTRALPLGLALSAVHPRVFVPVGMRFSPRLGEDLLTAHFSLSGNDHAVFFPPPSVGAPFAISRGSFSPLSRSAVHPEALENALDVAERIPALATAGEPVVYHPVGSSLRKWDGTSGPTPNALPPGPETPRQLPPRRT